MARRLFNGNAFSEDGWPYVDEGSCTWIVVRGTENYDPPVHLQIQNGPPLILLGAWAADWNAYIEPLRDADSACWTPGNSVATSNHPGGTAEDLNWELHAFHVRGTLNAAQMATMAEMEAFYEGMVFWAGRWDDPVDEMHSQMGYGTYDQGNDRPEPKVLDFINRKIRSDGFSKFRREGVPLPPPPPPPSAVADVLVRATGLSLGRATEILPTVSSGLLASQCNNVNRIAMWLAQCGEESAGFSTTEEFASGAEYEGRTDLGNTQPGDGVRFKGRTWIQITGKAHYGEFSQWAFSKGFVHSPTQFLDDPVSLGDLRWAGIGAAWYWTVSRPDINALSDAGDVVTVTHRINGGEHGLADRQQRYARAHALGDQLLALTTAAPGPIPPGDDDLSAEAERMIGEIYAEWRKEKLGPSRSFLATDGRNIESPLGFIYNIDGNVWTQQLTWAYLFHVPLAIEVVESVAKNGSYAGSWVASNEFNAWLNRFGQSYCQGLVGFKKALVAKLTNQSQQSNAPASPAYSPPVVPDGRDAELSRLREENDRLREENARLRVIPAVTPVSTEVATVEPAAKTSGERIGHFLDSAEDAVELLNSMTALQRLALTRAQTLLETNQTNGA